MPTLTVALDSTRKRDLKMVVGDEFALGIVVYEKDGDAVPLSVSNLKFLFSKPADNITLGLNANYTVPDEPPGRRTYIIKGDIAGYTRTLVYGVLEVYGEDGYYTGDITGIGFISGGNAGGGGGGGGDIPDDGMVDEFGNAMVDEFGDFIVG